MCLNMKIWSRVKQMLVDHLIEVVGHGSETQLQVSANFK